MADTQNSGKGTRSTQKERASEAQKRKNDKIVNEDMSMTRTRSKRSKEPRELSASEIRRHQFVPLILIVAALLVVISYLLVEKSGVFGKAIKYVFYGLFGLAAYAIPVLLVIAALNWQKYVISRTIRLNMILFSVTMLCLSSFVEIIALSSAAEDPGWKINIKDIFLDGIELKNGGVIGGLIGIVFRNIFGSVGSYIVIVAGIIVLIMALFGATPVTVAVFLSNKVKNKIKERRRVKTAVAEEGYNADPARSRSLCDDSESDTENVRFLPNPSDEEHAGIPIVKKKGNDNETEKRHPVNVRIVRDRGETVADHSDDTSDVAEASTVKKPLRRSLPHTESMHTVTNESGDSLDGLQNTLDVGSSARKTFKTAEMPEQIGLSEDIAEFDMNDPEPVPKRVERSVRDLGDVSDLSDITGVVTPLKTPVKPYAVSDAGTAESEKASDTTNIQNGSDPDDGQPILVNPYENYKFPPITLLSKSDKTEQISDEEINANIDKLMDTLTSFKIRVSEITCSCGPTITRYEVKPESGVRVRSIANLVDDISLGLAKSGVRIEAPIPGKSAVGIEVPNDKAQTVYLRSLIESKAFTDMKSRISACLGADVGGRPITFDIAKMPHLLVAGATGMGKSVCINSIIVSLLYKSRPDEVKLVLIDPKKVEFGIYKDIPHLFVPIVSDPKKAAGTLATAVSEMERRFAIMEEIGVKDLAKYNEVTRDDPDMEYMPQIVIIIDELADLMMTAPDEVETSICRITQKARAAGIHLIIGTQRPSVDVITGLIKANIPSRIAFTVASQVDSRTIIDIAGAEKLIGRGDMLYAPVGSAKPIRVQGAFVSETEVENISEYLKKYNGKAIYNEMFARQIDAEAEKCGMGKKGAQLSSPSSDSDEGGIDGEDPKLREAIEVGLAEKRISTSLLQRKLQVGYGRAAKIIDRLQEMGIVGAPDGNKPRRITITPEQYEDMIMNNKI